MIKTLSSRNLNLPKLALLNDHELATVLFEIIKKLRSFQPRQAGRRKTTRKLTSSSSLKLLHAQTTKNISQFSPVEGYRRVSLKASPRNNSSPYSLDQVLTLTNVFQQLGSFYQETAWVRNSNRLEIHTVLLKQFLLDCYMSDQKLFQCILEPVKNKLWITSEDFLKCIEELHMGYRWKFFASRKIKKLENRNIQKQKLLFFFSLIAFEKGSLLDRENIKKAIDFAERQNNFKLDNLTDFFMQKATEGRGLSFLADVKDLLTISLNL